MKLHYVKSKKKCHAMELCEENFDMTRKLHYPTLKKYITLMGLSYINCASIQ